MVVVLIIGILAAIALPNFIGQRDRAEDAKSKSDVRNTVTHIEACYTSTEDYRKCTTLADLGTGLGIPLGTGPGSVEIVPDTASGFTATGNSRTGASFSIVKSPSSWKVTRKCQAASGNDSPGGCVGGKW